MTDKIFTPKGGWQKGQLVIYMAESNGKALIKQTHFKSEFFKIPHKENECGVCKLLEENKK